MKSENEKFCSEGVMEMSIKSRVYVVRKGRKTGVFNSWEECELQVAGITGAQFRTFDGSQEEEIEKYLNEHLMNSIKCYAVKREGFLGVFETWEECQTELTTFPESTHKGFPTLKEAYQFLGVKNKTELKQMEQKRKREQEQLQEQKSIQIIQRRTTYYLCVGGSYASQ
jgi:viroplasmin and RNaseH domain-containing protein